MLVTVKDDEQKPKKKTKWVTNQIFSEAGNMFFLSGANHEN